MNNGTEAVDEIEFGTKVEHGKREEDRADGHCHDTASTHSNGVCIMLEDGTGSSDLV